MKAADMFLPEMGEIHIGYHRGYSMLLFQMMGQMIVVGFIIMIAITPVFAEEHSKGTDALILTAKYGRSAGIKAKTAAAFLFSTLLCLADIAVNGICFLLVYGTEGWDTSVQIDFMKRNWEILYEMNYAKLAGCAVLLWILACWVLTGMSLLLSACCRSAFAAVIVTSACYVIPALMQPPDWCKAVLPVYQTVPQPVLNMGGLSVGGWKVPSLYIVAAVSAAAAVVLSVWAKKRFAGHQVE